MRQLFRTILIEAERLKLERWIVPFVLTWYVIHCGIVRKQRGLGILVRPVVIRRTLPGQVGQENTLQARPRKLLPPAKMIGMVGALSAIRDKPAEITVFLHVQ